MMHVIVAAALSASPGRCNNGPPQEGTAVWRPETTGSDLVYTFTYCPEDACLRVPGQSVPQEDNGPCYGNQLKSGDSRFLDVDYLCKAATEEHSVCLAQVGGLIPGNLNAGIPPRYSESKIRCFKPGDCINEDPSTVSGRDRCMNLPHVSDPVGVYPNQYPYLHSDGDAFMQKISTADARNYNDGNSYTSWGQHDADAVAADGTTPYRYYFNQDFYPSAAIDCSGLALYEETTTPTTTTTTTTATTTTTTTTATTTVAATTATTTPGGLCTHSATFGAPRSALRPAARGSLTTVPFPSFLRRRHGTGRRQRAGRLQRVNCRLVGPGRLCH
jgi:hypothetical protein